MKWKNVRTVPAFNRKIVEICKFDISNTHINDPSWLSSGTSIKSDGVKLVYSKIFLLFNKNNRKRKSHDFCTTIGQWSGDRRR